MHKNRNPLWLRQFIQAQPRHTSSRSDVYREAFHAHPGLELLYIHEGCGQVEVNRSILPVESGGLLLFRPLQSHRVAMDIGKSPYTRSYLILNPNLLEPYLSVFPQLTRFCNHLFHGSGDALTLAGLDEADPLAALLFEIIDEVAMPTADPVLTEPVVRLLLFLMHGLQERIGSRCQCPAAVPADHRIERVMQWISEHYMEEFSLGRMAECLHLSSNYLSHSFRKDTGSTILDYLHAHRAKQACLLLAETDDPIGLISEKTGYADTSYFCRIFKENVGLTPLQYRKRCQS